MSEDSESTFAEEILNEDEVSEQEPKKTPEASPLDKKINQYFPGLVVRKDLVKAVKGNAIVPSYVLEYLLGQYAASDDEATIQAGITTVRKILADHYVHRNQAELVKSTIRERGRHKIIDRVTVTLNEKEDVYEAEFSNLGVKQVLVEPGTIKAHPKLLAGGVWCICDIEYEHGENSKAVPWILGSIKPIQLSNFDSVAYLAARGEFTTDEWIDLLMQSIGFNPQMFSRREKLLQLVRLIPYCERNYNVIELGPKGTGKSHIYSEFSPHGMLISGGEVTVAKLFVNNASGRLGLVGYWDCVAFDEFAGKTKRPQGALVDIMKNYMANKSFSRGVETLGADASMVFVGNTQHTVPYMLRHSDLFDELPDAYHDSAFLDRIHHYIPGWEMDMIRSEMFSDGYGFVVDYIAEVLKDMRPMDFSDLYQSQFTLSSDISTRDRDGVHKTFSGLMKILYPNHEANRDEIEELLRLSIEGRKRVKDQLVRMDPTITKAIFSYSDDTGEIQNVTTREQDEYPSQYDQQGDASTKESEAEFPAPSDAGDGGLETSAQGAPASNPLEDLLVAGESQNLEFKSSARWNKRREPPGLDKAIEHAIYKTVAGFLNSDGGVLIIGVNDDGEPLGLSEDIASLGSKSNLDGFELFLRDLLDANLSATTAGTVRTSFETLDEKDICIVRVSRSGKPVYAKKLKESQKSEFWVRVGNATKQLHGEDSDNYKKDHWV